MTLRLHFRRLKSRFLGRFAEVRDLRAMESRKNAIIDEMRLEAHKVKEENRSLATANHANLAQIEELRRGMAVTLEARVNADRHVDVLRGELAGIREISEREITGMRQMVDALAPNAIGRQVFGTAPLVMRSREPESDPQPVRISAREAAKQQTEQFFRNFEAVNAAKGQSAQAGGQGGYGQQFSDTDKAVNVA